MRSSNEIVCPRCKTRMEYRLEIELGDGNYRKLIYYYRCPRCGYRVHDMLLNIKRNNGQLVVEVEELVHRATGSAY